MKSCIVRRRFYASEFTAGTSVTVDLEPGFGIAKAAIINYVEQSAIQPDTYDQSLFYRNVGTSFIGSTDSTVTSTLTGRVVNCVMLDGVAATGVTKYKRGNQNTRIFTLSDTQASASSFFQGALLAGSTSFGTDRFTITTIASTPQTGSYMDCIMTFFGGDDLNVGVGHTQFPNGATSLAYSRLGFQPDVVFLISDHHNIAGGATTDDFRFSYGAATRSPAAQASIYYHGENTSGNTDIATYYSSSQIACYNTNTGVGPYPYTIGSFVVGGWTMTGVNANPGNSNFYQFLAMSTTTPLQNFALNDNGSSTSAGTAFSSTSFIPKIIFGAGLAGTLDGTRETVAPATDCFYMFAGERSAHSNYFNGTGTIQTNSAGTLVTGVSTQFLRFYPGQKLYQQDGTLIGIVNNVGTATSLSLSANAASTLAPGTSYVFSTPGQYCLTYGTRDGQATTDVTTSYSENLIRITTNAGTATTNVLASLSGFDTRPGYELNFNTVSFLKRKFWVMGVADDDIQRRGGMF